MSTQMNHNQNPFQAKKPTPNRNHASFIEALKGIGSQTASSLTRDVVGGVSKNMLQDLTGSRTSLNPDIQHPENSQDIETRIRQEALALQRHREVNETKIFDRKEEEIKAKISAIKEQLQLLMQELAGMDKELEKAIEEEIVNPGTYHLNFFEKLRKILLDLRKRVADSANWLEVSSQRKAAQQGFWGNVKKSGTKYLLSQERTLATQAG
jgi:hypothetical protein